MGERWVHIELGELAPGQTRAVQVAELDLLVCNVDGSLHAVENRCTHARVALTSAPMVDGVIECPVHAARFDARTGAVVARPARRGLRSFPVQVDEQGIRIGLPLDD